MFYIGTKTGLLYSGKNQGLVFQEQRTQGVILVYDRRKYKRQENTILGRFMTCALREIKLKTGRKGQLACAERRENYVHRVMEGETGKGQLGRL
jgi:hypothetical protein